MYSIHDQTDYHDDIQVSSEHFGVNLVTTFNEEFIKSSSLLSNNVNKMGISTLRFPGGSATEHYFDMRNPNASISNSPPYQELTPMDDFFRESGIIGVNVSLVIPAKDGFEDSAVEAMKNGTYGNRTELSENYVSNAIEYVSKAITEAVKNDVKLISLEIGNEFWGSGEMTASEYGFLAGTLSTRLKAYLDDVGFHEIDIIVQTTSSATRIYSPRDDTEIYIGQDGNGIEKAFSKYEVDRDFGEIVPVGWIAVTVPGQGSAKGQSENILEKINQISGAADAIDGVALHYYVSNGFDSVDTEKGFAFDQLSYFADGLDRSASAPDIEFHITEWNTNANGADNNRGLQHASMIVEGFYELVTHGVNHAQIWPLAFDTSQGITLVTPDGNNLTIAGEMYRLMSESLVGLHPVLDWSEVGQLDVHGFSDNDRSVLFISERSGSANEGIEMDVELVRDKSDYFLTYTELSDGGSGGSDHTASPVVSYSNGITANSDIIEFDMSAWSNMRIELTHIGNGSDRIIGRSGDDIILTKRGEDYVSAGSGNDSIRGGFGDDTILGGSGNDTIFGGSGNDIIRGNARGDVIHGGNGRDRISGGGGNDLIIGGVGNDTLTGGPGNDRFVLATGAGHDTISDYEIGSDIIDISSHDIWGISRILVTQLEGAIQLHLNSDDSVTLEGINFLSLSNSNFILSAQLALVGTEDGEKITGSLGADVIDSGAGEDSVRGNGGDDLITGGSGNDTLYGDDDNDTIYGGLGKDKIVGGSGDDQLVGEGDNDRIYGGTGSDDLNGGSANDRLYGNDGNDNLIAGNGNDKLWGDAGNDSLSGGSGKDLMRGGSGDDILSGGTGNDQMTGGIGADEFVFRPLMHSDIVTDFEDGIDLLDFSGYGIDDISDLTIAQSGTSTQITLAAESSALLTLWNTSAADFSNDDFVFV